MTTPSPNNSGPPNPVFLIPSILKTYLSGSVGYIQEWPGSCSGERFFDDLQAHALLIPMHLAFGLDLLPRNLPAHVFDRVTARAESLLRQKHRILDELTSMITRIDSRMLYHMEIIEDSPLFNVTLWFCESVQGPALATLEETLDLHWTASDSVLKWSMALDDHRIPIHTVFLPSRSDFQVQVTESFLHRIAQNAIDRRLDRMRDLFLFSEILWKTGGFVSWDNLLEHYRNTSHTQAIFAILSLSKILFSAPIPIDISQLVSQGTLANFLIQRWLPAVAVQEETQRSPQQQRLVEVLLTEGNLAAFAAENVAGPLKKLISRFR